MIGPDRYSRAAANLWDDILDEVRGIQFYFPGYGDKLEILNGRLPFEQGPDDGPDRPKTLPTRIAKDTDISFSTSRKIREIFGSKR